MHALALNASVHFRSRLFHFLVVPGGAAGKHAEAALGEEFRFPLRRLPLAGKWFAPDDAVTVGNLRLTAGRAGAAVRCRIGIRAGGLAFSRSASLDGRLAKRLLQIFHSLFTAETAARNAPPDTLRNAAKEAVMPGRNGAVAAQAQAEAVVRLLRASLTAVVEKDAGGGFRMLVAPSGAEGGEMSLREIVAEINSLPGADAPPLIEKDIADRIGGVAALSSAPAFDPSELRLALRQAFLYVPGGGGAAEYAFSLEVRTRGVAGARLGVFAVESVRVSVWNTDRRAVLERMGLFRIGDFLED